MNKQLTIIALLTLVCSSLVFADPAGNQNSVENIAMSLKATREMVGTWKTPTGVIELKADGTIHSSSGSALWRVEANPHATNLVIFTSDYTNGKEHELHDYKVTYTPNTINTRDLDSNNALETWHRINH